MCLAIALKEGKDLVQISQAMLFAILKVKPDFLHNSPEITDHSFCLSSICQITFTFSQTFYSFNLSVIRVMVMAQ